MCVPSVHTIHNIYKYKTLFYLIFVLPLRFLRTILQSFRFSFALFRNRFALALHYFRIAIFDAGASAPVRQLLLAKNILAYFCSQNNTKIAFICACRNLPRFAAICAHLQLAPACNWHPLAIHMLRMLCMPYTLISPLRFWVMSPLIIFFG